jgi:hypothetical protein
LRNVKARDLELGKKGKSGRSKMRAREGWSTWKKKSVCLIEVFEFFLFVGSNVAKRLARLKIHKQLLVHWYNAGTAHPYKISTRIRIEPFHFSFSRPVNGFLGRNLPSFSSSLDSFVAVPI